MSYFDHVKCHACRAMLDPEQLGRQPGQGLTCPQCNAPLSLTDLFGLSAAFAEEEEGDLSLDDLMGSTGGASASAPGQQRPAPRAAPRAQPGRAPPTPSSGAMVRRSAPNDEEDDGPSGSAALDLMRQLKRKK